MPKPLDITADDIEAAYEATGLEPINNSWVGYERVADPLDSDEIQRKPCSACGLGVLIAAKHGVEALEGFKGKNGPGEIAYAASMLDLAEGDVKAFMYGFDNDSEVNELDPDVVAVGLDAASRLGLIAESVEDPDKE